MVVKEELFDELSTNLKQKNLTVAAGPSRSTVSFTNNFTLVAPLLDGDSQIDIYRPLTKCVGTPCNANKKHTSSGAELILCECITNSSDTNIFAKSFKEAADVTENATTTIGDTVKDGAETIFTDPTTLSDYKIWRNSVMIVFVCLTILGIAAVLLEGPLISPLAVGFFNKVSVEFMISQQLKQIRCEKPKMSEKIEADKSKSNSSDSDKSDKPNKKTTREEQEKISKLKRCFDEDKGISKAFNSVSTFKEMSNLRLLVIIYLTNHYMLSVFCSKSVHYSRKSMIVNLYDRVAYNLAITMLFAIGYSKEGFSSYQQFILKCLFLPFVTAGVLFFIKKLMKNDVAYGMSIFKWWPNKNVTSTKCPVEASTSPNPNASRLDNDVSLPHNKVTPNKRGRTPSRVEVKGKSESPARSTNEFLDHGKRPVSKADTNTGLNSPVSNGSHNSLDGKDADCKGYNPTKIDQVKDTAKKSTKAVVMIIASYVLSLSLLPISAFIIVSVAKNTTDNDTWPVGYWYYLQLGYDLSLGQMIPALMQLGFLKLFLKGQSQTTGLASKLAKKNFLLNSDVKALTDLNASVSH